MKKLLLLAILLTGCTDEFQYVQPTSTQGESAKEILLTTIQGCDIYKIRIKNEPTLFLSKCKDSSTIKYDTGGKHSYSVPTITYKDTL
jgi:hypothetical protein